MKVLQINAVNGIRSTGRICTEIADYLNSNGDEGYIAYSHGVPYEKGYRIGSAMDVKLHGLLSRITGLQGYFSKHSTKKLIKFIDKIKPDIIHLHNLHSNYINLKLLLSYIATNDIATVITLHDCWFFTGKCCHYTVDNCFKWHKKCYDCPRIHKDNPSWFFDRTKKMFQDKKEWFRKIPRLAVIGVSDWLTNEAFKSHLSSAKIIKRIYNWIDLNVFRSTNGDHLREQLGISDKYIILGVSVYWSNNTKGLDEFIELAKLLPDDIQIILIGNVKDDTSLPKEIINITETNNINELVTCYSAADVLLNLSPEETFGLVSVEALSCGTPVIAYNSTACSEVIGDSNCGIIVEVGNMDEIISAIMKIKCNGKSFYSKECRNRAAFLYDKNKNIFEYYKIYQSLSIEKAAVEYE